MLHTLVCIATCSKKNQEKISLNIFSLHAFVFLCSFPMVPNVLLAYIYIYTYFKKCCCNQEAQATKTRPQRTAVLLLVINLFMVYFHYLTSQITQSMAASEDNSITATFSCNKPWVWLISNLWVPAFSAVLACYLSLFVVTKFFEIGVCTHTATREKSLCVFTSCYLGGIWFNILTHL